MTYRIGFVSTRLAGTDGVSLEVTKWANTLQTMDCQCFYFAGESDRLPNHSTICPEAHFNHPDIRTISDDLFGNYVRSRATSQMVQNLKVHLKEDLYRFIEQFEIEMLIVENALSIPMNIPLGLAITEVIAETDMPAIAHNHDFVWERSRFAINAADDYLRAAFPPTLRSIHHVVINSFGSQQLALRTGAHSITLIPNVMNFEQPPPERDGYSDDLRRTLGIAEDEHFLLQPTRIVPRKRIEQAIELTRRLGDRAVLVITHSAGDEGQAYPDYLREYAQTIGARVVFAAEHFNHIRRQTADGGKIYALADAYYEADVVTYPSMVEGFGNVFLETIYYKRPIVMNTYEIFKTDIQPKGFRVIGFQDFMSDDTVKAVREVLEHPAQAAQVAEENYELGRRYYSYKTLENHLRALLTSALGKA